MAGSVPLARRAESHCPFQLATKGDASRWLVKVEADQARGTWVDPSAAKVLLSDFAEEWLRGKVRIASRTREVYASQLRLHILPGVGEGLRPLAKCRWRVWLLS